MAHHAYVTTGTGDEVLARARAYGKSLGADTQTFSFGLFSVDDARRIGAAAYQSGTSDQKVIAVYAARLFHEAQNSLLKVFEEPPAGVTLILGVPSTGILLPTLRSRLLSLPGTEEASTKGSAMEFLSLSAGEREKFIAKLIDRTKSDKDDVKQAGRAEAAELIQGLMHAAHQALGKAKTPQERQELLAFLDDLSAFMPLMYERSAAIKLIFEHILLVVPKGLDKA